MGFEASLEFIYQITYVNDQVFIYLAYKKAVFWLHTLVAQMFNMISAVCFIELLAHYNFFFIFITAVKIFLYN